MFRTSLSSQVPSLRSSRLSEQTQGTSARRHRRRLTVARRSRHAMSHHEDDVKGRISFLHCGESLEPVDSGTGHLVAAAAEGGGRHLRQRGGRRVGCGQRGRNLMRCGRDGGALLRTCNSVRVSRRAHLDIDRHIVHDENAQERLAGQLRRHCRSVDPRDIARDQSGRRHYRRWRRRLLWGGLC